VDGGAWPFLVGGVICLVNSDNERDSNQLIDLLFEKIYHLFVEKSKRNYLRGHAIVNSRRKSNNRSVMPLDVLGRTRATINNSSSYPF
jgi:hypothetical protein